MIVKEITNIDDIKTILCHPEIYDCITTDESGDSESYDIPINDIYLYVGGYVKGEIIAVMVYHDFRDGLELHIQVLPNFRNEYALEFGERGMMFRGRKPLYATIPDLYKNILDYALSFGFEVIERIESTETKNGKTFIDNVLKYKEVNTVTALKGGG